jgi:GTP-binding protein HflX
MGKKQRFEALPTTGMHPKTILVGVIAPYNKMKSSEYYFDEFLSLVDTLGMDYDDTYFIKLRNVDSNTFLTRGKLQELADFCKEHKVREVVFSELLSPVQERNLEDALDAKVFDREALILNIFKNSAKTSEGKIQIDMAELNFMRTRLLGKGIEFAQQAGYIGGRGPGETISEEIRRHFADKQRQAKKKLETLQKARDVQRQQRLQSNHPLVCIIGYTNAGKSSLLNILTRSEVLAEDKLFATLDTTTRELYVDPKLKVLISDTVGFISQLPHALIEAFKSTLDELRFASLLLHVIDISNPAWENQIKVVKETLKELGVDKPMVFVFNKIDKLTPEELESNQEKINLYEPHILIHTRSKEGVENLVTLIRHYKF